MSGVDVHVWRHVGSQAPRALTGVADISRDEKSDGNARILDAFHGHQNAIDEQSSHIITIQLACHVVRLGIEAVDDSRCSVRQARTGKGLMQGTVTV